MIVLTGKNAPAPSLAIWNEAVGNSKSEKKYFFFNREKIQKKASFGEALCKSCVIDEYGIAIFFVKSPVNICLLVIFPLI